MVGFSRYPEAAMIQTVCLVRPAGRCSTLIPAVTSGFMACRRHQKPMVPPVTMRA